MYFLTRLCHYSGLFSKNNDYVFMCQQYVERSQLESNIDITTQKGVMTTASDGTKSMKLTDAFSVFQKIRGTPKYWQSKRNNLLAMINVLGPFHYFCTFSCAELRWPEVIATVLRKRKLNVTITKNYLDKDEEVIIITHANGKEESLNDYLLRTGQSVRSILQQETFLVTRMFNHR